VTDPGAGTGGNDRVDRAENELAVRRALSALADGSAPTNLESFAYRSVIDEAVAAVECVREAASVVGDAGRLRRAVTAAERRDDEATAARGRRVLNDLERYRRAAAGGDQPRGSRRVRRCPGESPDDDRACGAGGDFDDAFDGDRTGVVPAAVAGAFHGDSDEGAGVSDPDTEVVSTDETGDPGRGTVLPGDGQSPDR
jgi:hypothetical protein